MELIFKASLNVVAVGESLAPLVNDVVDGNELGWPKTLLCGAGAA
jgi:hypothetical protein